MKIVSDKYKKMYETEFQDVNKHCKKCKLLEETYEKLEKGTMTSDDLGDLRKECTNCKRSKSGIYKADAILGAYSKKKPPKGGKRKSRINSKNKEAVLKLIKKGVKYREIAELTGFSISEISRMKNEEK